MFRKLLSGLLLTLCISHLLHAEITTEAPLTLSNFFVKADNENPLLTSAISYTFSGTQADKIDYIRLCIATNNTCSTCVRPYKVITQGTPVPYSTTGTTLYIRPEAIYAYLSEAGLGAGSYNIGLYVQSQSLSCASGAAWCSTNRDTAGSPHRLCIQATSDGNSVTALSQSDNGQAQLNISAKPYTYYVGNFPALLSCAVTSSGNLGTCTPSGAVNFPNLGAVVNPAGTTLYVAASTFNNIGFCSINSNTGTSSACISTSAVTSPRGITMNPAGSIVYVTNASNLALVCPVTSGSSGTLGTCVSSGATGLNSPQGIAINPANTYAYIASTNNDAIRKCTVGTGGALSSCADIGNGLNKPFGIAINKAGTFAYVVNNGNNSVSKCPINPDGTFGTCTDSGASGTPFITPEYIALDKNGTTAYITNFTSNTASVCVINPDGSFGTCSPSTNTTINSAHGVAYTVTP